ncbi:MFS general substrate transporter [Conidiobolus coronatus NRRL 28638]|uniref:MFS general substrate transporter n=1 Tax=Conidiobolus coronatus (strain ATCC 28846 / CBS 209.66 / NRRL 28638) TaxID=796925 RepID=A0A137PDL0_CONC2|nr:MFS general substrate transporter [Conidiobolus coronatus NRRL 28638]|eukprot:KXN73070.1 MFS general substrate transporter [Conidiobolus coronatus NRRL 28638]
MGTFTNRGHDEFPATNFHRNNGSDPNIVSKMTQIRSTVDNWTIYLGVLLLGFTLAICSGATYQLTWTITSSFSSFDIGPVVDVVNGLLGILFIPLFAALSDVYGRGLILTFSLILCVIGLFVTGTAGDFGAYSAGNIIGGLGETGRALLFPIILADFLSPRNRGFGFFLNWFPSCIALGAALPVIQAAQEGDQWRWIYKAQGIMTIVTAIPILFGLFRLQMKAQRFLPQFNYQASSLRKVDWVGIVLLTAGFSCILIPFSLVVRKEDGWSDPSIYVPIIFGALILIAFLVWEIKFVKHPLVSRKLLTNRAAMVMIVVRAFLSFDSTFTWTYMTSYLGLTREIDQFHVAQIYLGFRITWYIAGFICALFLKKFNHIRIIVWASLLVNAIGMGLALHSRHPHSAEWYVVFAEAVIGLGAGFSSCAGLVVLQSTVDFTEIANISAIDSLVTSVFTSIAISITNALWNSTTAASLMERLPEQFHDKIGDLLADNKYTDIIPEEFKENWIAALGDSQWLMCTIGTILACICLGISFLLPPVDLDKCQQDMFTKDLNLDNEMIERYDTY